MLAARKLNQEYAYEYEEFSPARRTTSSRKIRPKKAGAAREKLIIITSICFIFVVGLMFTATQAMITDRSNKIIQVKSEITDLQNGNERIKLKIAQKKSLDRIEMIARTELGMVQPDEKSIEYIASTQPADQPTVAMAMPKTSGKASVAVEKGEKIHPALQSFKQMISAYIIGIEHVEASEQ